MQRKQWIVSHVKKVEPNRRISNPEKSRRNYTRKYFFPGEIQLCQKMFIRTLGYTTEKVIDIALQDSEHDIATIDQRGKHPPKHKISAKIISSW